MPEGHTIHRHARLQNALLAGKTLRVTSPQGRFTEAERFDVRKLREVEPHGKHLLYHFTSGTLHVHLGMYGRFWVRRAGRDAADGNVVEAETVLAQPAEDEPTAASGETNRDTHAKAKQKRQRTYDATVTDHADLPEATPTTRMRLLVPAGGKGRGDAALAVDLTGPTACEFLDQPAMEKLRGRLGPDPLKTPGDEVGAAIGERIRRSKAPVGTLLMDQSVLSGVGNAYRSELLFRAGLDPRTPGNTLTPDQWLDLWRDTVSLLNIGVKHQHILCVEPAFVGKSHYRELPRDERFWVYKRETCRRCSGPIEHFHLAGRSVYACPAEQRFPGRPAKSSRKAKRETSSLKHHA